MRVWGGARTLVARNVGHVWRAGSVNAHLISG